MTKQAKVPFAPLCPVQLTQPQREEILKEIDAYKQRIADLGLALRDNGVDRAMVTVKALADELAERINSLLRCSHGIDHGEHCPWCAAY